MGDVGGALLRIWAWASTIQRLRKPDELQTQSLRRRRDGVGHHVDTGTAGSAARIGRAGGGHEGQAWGIDLLLARRIPRAPGG